MLFAAGCSNNKLSESSAATQSQAVMEPVKSKLNEEGTKMLVDIVTNYYTLKNAMTATNAADATNAAAKLAAATDTLQSFLQKDSLNSAMSKPYLDTIIIQSLLTASFNDPSCEKQRIVFGTISSAMYGLLKKTEIRNAKIYHEMCPMAFNDKGATWLSSESDIKNPYFGKKMLECGEVTDTLN